MKWIPLSERKPDYRDNRFIWYTNGKWIMSSIPGNEEKDSTHWLEINIFTEFPPLPEPECKDADFYNLKCYFKNIMYIDMYDIKIQKIYEFLEKKFGEK